MNGETGKCLASASYPTLKESKIIAIKPGWAEQEPEMWYQHLLKAIENLHFDLSHIAAIGISYQMHGLVAIDKNGSVVRSSIIWCDSRAVDIGDKAFTDLGEEYCFSNLLNSPANFTASKLRWVQENEPDIYREIDKVMLPGDYLAYRLTGVVSTTASALSEAILWNYPNESVDEKLLDYFSIDKHLIPEILPTFSEQGKINRSAAKDTGIPLGVPVTYRAGDQPNNAFSLNVNRPGEVAATAGTSGVVYGVTDKPSADKKGRLNTFLHVNHQKDNSRYGILMCINGVGILNSWLRDMLFSSGNYNDMNILSQNIQPGSDGLLVVPFGNGSERILGNRNVHASILNLDFNKHTKSHIIRAGHEAVAFAFNYGMEILAEMGVNLSLIRVGGGNMFQSPVLRETIATLANANIEIFNTDGALGAARAAGLGVGFFASEEEAFLSLERSSVINPNLKQSAIYKEIYEEWKSQILTLTLNP